MEHYGVTKNYNSNHINCLRAVSVFILEKYPVQWISLFTSIRRMYWNISINAFRISFHEHSDPHQLWGAPSGGFWDAACFTLGSYLSYSPTLDMKTTFSTETSINLYWTKVALYGEIWNYSLYCHSSEKLRRLSLSLCLINRTPRHEDVWKRM